MIQNRPGELIKGICRDAGEIRGLLRQGKILNHRKQVDNLMEEVRKFWQSLPLMDPLDDEVHYALLRAEIMLYASLDDYFDQVPPDLSEKILDRGGKMGKNIEADIDNFITTHPDPHLLDSKVLSLLKHKLAYQLAYSNELYRRDEISKSLEVVERLYECIHKLKGKLNNHKEGVDGLLARVCVQRAKSHRQKMEYQSSRKFYSEAFQAYLESARRKPPDEYKYYLHRTAMVIAGGSGFINLSRGLLTRATLGSESAQMMLLQSENTVYQMYLQTLGAGILRAQAGYKEDELVAARKLLEDAYQVLGKISHYRYMLLAANELVLTCIYLEDFATAFKYVEEIRRLAEGKDSDGMSRPVRMADSARWLITANLLESLSRRRQGGAHASQIALNLAQKATEKARRLGLKRSQLEALILEGEALFSLGKYPEARKSFIDARGLNYEEGRGDSPKVISDQHLYVVSLLYLCRIAIKTFHPDVAKGHYDEVKKFGVIEHKWVEDLRAKTESEMKGIDEFFPLRDIPDGGYPEAIEDLRIWLFKQARKKHGPNLTRIAKELKLTRAAIHRWFNRKELDKLLNSTNTNEGE